LHACKIFLESCKCGIIGTKKIFEAPTYKYVTDGGSELALNFCNSPSSAKCKCKNMCICGEDGSCYNLNNTLLKNDQVVAVYFWSHCTEQGEPWNPNFDFLSFRRMSHVRRIF
jgi:hypothetical protein